MRGLRRLGQVTFEALESRHLLAATPQLLADINTQQSGSPQEMVEFQGRLFYVASHAEFGREIYSTDGTEEGTLLLKDIWPGSASSSPANLVVSGNYLYFSASSEGLGSELWRTDGTAAGTILLRDINPGSGGSIYSTDEIVDVAGTLFFVADDGQDEGLWKSDGTPAGTQLLKIVGDGSLDISELTAVGNTLFFLGDDQVHGEELWKSDGTSAGTVMVKDIAPGSSRSWADQLIEFSGELYFTARESGFSSTLWRSDGTLAGTTPVPVPAGLSFSSAPFVVSGSTLYFTANTAATGIELWRTDGTLDGTSLVVDLAPGSASSAPANMFGLNGTVYFTSSVGGEMKLWRTDGTAPGTVSLASLEKQGLAPLISDMAAYGGNLYFITNSHVFGSDLWRSDGTMLGTFPLQAGIVPAGSNSSLAVAAGQLFFAAKIGGTGLELWRSTGDYTSTRRVIDFMPLATDSSRPANFVATGTHVFFTADDGHGTQLWSSGAVPGNVVRLTPSYYGVQSSEIEQLTPVGNLLYFVGSDLNGRRYLGVSDGTPQGTRALNWPLGLSVLQVSGVTPFADGVIFTARDSSQGMMVLRANSQHVESVYTLGPSWSLPPALLYQGHTDPVVSQGTYYFLASSINGQEVWLTDGTAQGTHSLRSIAPQIGYAADSITRTDSAVYFIARVGTSPSSGAGLWRTDGTALGTFSVPGAFPQKMLGAGDKLYFTSSTSPSTVTLRVTDGTGPGTIALATILDDTLGITDSRLKAAVFDGLVYFFGAPSFPAGPLAPLWRTDGTPAGTFPLADGPTFFTPRSDVATVGGQLLISDGMQLFASNGLPGGTTTAVNGFRLPPLQSLADSVAVFDDKYIFSNSDPAVSLEPFYAEIATPATVIGRHLFYNGSKFDGGSPALNDADDNAIATDKSPYLAGSGVAGFETISSYARGINGVMIDFANLPGLGTPAGITPADFVFRVGTNNDLATWTTAPAPLDFSIRFPTGNSGQLARASFRWADGAIANTWLEITVLANARTGLKQPDVFYFGSRIGDSGVSPPPTIFTTSVSDDLIVRANPGFNQPITSRYDYDRNGLVSLGDSLVVRANIGLLTRLNLPAPTAAAPLAASQSSETAAQVEPAAYSPDSQPLVSQSHVSRPLISAPLSDALASPSRDIRGELLAFAAQSWRDWLDADDEDDLLAGVAVAPRTRR